jgi:hypothetical protein
MHKEYLSHGCACNQAGQVAGPAWPAGADIRPAHNQDSQGWALDGASVASIRL